MSEARKPRDKHYNNILGAAREEFALHGLKGARMQAIADRAGLPKANIHYYFNNKVSLYQAVLNHIMETWNDFFNDVDVKDAVVGLGAEDLNLVVGVVGQKVVQGVHLVH